MLKKLNHSNELQKGSALAKCACLCICFGSKKVGFAVTGSENGILTMAALDLEEDILNFILK
ncbi:MAG TPA: hypothetical protein DCW90_06275 [Lachnospiraceae bacterium]|nr:hypothetical protein [uncultured Lachnoclostridium sp.]HAU85104.1 hypothetical protein [Lachnospiraceae bacterium]